MSGYLRQTDTPLPASEWDDALTEAVAGITGLSANMVRPRWQPMPPNQPPAHVDWCAVGITGRTAEDYPNFKLTDTGTILTRWFRLNVLVSFYGPNCETLAEQLRDGLYIPQNQEQLALTGIKLHGADDLTKVPDLMNAQWIEHVDLPIVFAAVVDRNYAIFDVVGSEGTITTDTGTAKTWDVHL